MTNERLLQLASEFGIDQPKITFLRQNENMTYRVDDADGASYLMRIHQPVTDHMAGLQHTYEGLLGELHMLDALARENQLRAQRPVRNLNGEFIAVTLLEGKQLNCSMLTWIEGRDLQPEDLTNSEFAMQFGAQLAELHDFLRNYRHESLDKRPQQGIKYNDGMVSSIKDGYRQGLFTSSDVTVIENTIRRINSRLNDLGQTKKTWGPIHGDVGKGNIILTPERELCFIDFGFFGRGYYLLDIAMGACMLPKEHRDAFLKGYYGHTELSESEMALLEGFLLVGIIGYYAFQMGNESVHDWMRNRMPKLCADYCLPYLSGERIWYKV